MFNQTKNLDKNGKIKVSSFHPDHNYNDISRRLAIIKSYKLQINVLGYIADNGRIYGAEKLYSFVNARINKKLLHSNEFSSTSKQCAISLACKSIQRKKATPGPVKAYQNALKDDKISTNELQTAFNRLVRTMKRKGIFIQLENYL